MLSFVCTHRFEFSALAFDKILGVIKINTTAI